MAAITPELNTISSCSRCSGTIFAVPDSAHKLGQTLAKVHGVDSRFRGNDECFAGMTASSIAVLTDN